MNKKLNIQDLLADYRTATESQEQYTLNPNAALSKNHNRHVHEPDDYRMPYKRDVDRIIHSKAYSRYVDKTQVAYLVKNDHISHRSIHVQLVSSFARGMAEVLRLNTDLVEAISLGHDVGHPPFGHEGEGYLSALSQEHGNGAFSHPLQSCRLFTELEPLNLNLAVYDGFLCHDGGMCGNHFTPHYNKSWKDHQSDLKNKHQSPEENIWPMTLEGCLVKLCDTVSYVGRDLEDAICLGILSRDQIPETMLGNTNGQILQVIAQDVIHMSYDKNFIAISEEVYDALKTLRKFNFQKIYVHPKLKVESKKIKQSYRILFDILLNDLDKNKDKSHVWKEFSHNKSETYKNRTSKVQMVVDYISGMTDNYFLRTLEHLVLPKQIELS